MAILAVFSGNINKSQYEALRKEVGWERKTPPGGVFHAVGFDDSDHIHAADVWESADAMNTFVETRLMPAFQKLGMTPPDVVVYPVHNITAYESIQKHVV